MDAHSGGAAAAFKSTPGRRALESAPVPPPATLAGIALLVAGVVWALRVKPEPLPEAAAGAPH